MTDKKPTAQKQLTVEEWLKIGFSVDKDSDKVVTLEIALKAVAMARAQEREKTIAMIETLFLSIKNKSEQERFEQWKKDWLGK